MRRSTWPSGSSTAQPSSGQQAIDGSRTPRVETQWKGVEHGLAPDWPITYEDLAPFYDQADRLVGVSGLAGNPAMPPQASYPTPPLPLPLRAVGRNLAGAFDRLGWHWWPLPAGVISEAYDGRPACNGCSACAAGCARGSMSKFSLSVWPKALEAGVDLRPLARVERLERGKDGRLTGAVYVDRHTGKASLPGGRRGRASRELCRHPSPAADVGQPRQ